MAQDRLGRLIAAGVTRLEGFVVRRYLPDGSPDPSFGVDGQAKTTSFGGGARATATITQADGDVIVAGGAETAFAVVRYDETGERDRAFGVGGRVLTPAGGEEASALDVALADDGRILAGGYGVDLSGRKTAMLFAYRPDGSLDRSFGERGRVTVRARGGAPTALSGVEVLPSGKILLGGTYAGRFMLMRLGADGRIDPSFGGGDGRVLVDADAKPRCACATAHSLAVTPAGKPVLAGVDGIPGGGEAGVVARFRPGGALDPGFGEAGIVRTQRGARLLYRGLAVRPDGTILAAGALHPGLASRPRLALVRYRADGQLDSGFGRAGLFSRRIGASSIAHAAIAQPDGRVVVAGRATFGSRASSESPSLLDGAHFMLARFER